MQVHGSAGVATAVGSLPHTDGAAAVDFVLELLPDLPAVPSLPRRSPAERILAHGLVGVAASPSTRTGTSVSTSTVSTRWPRWC